MWMRRRIVVGSTTTGMLVWWVSFGFLLTTSRSFSLVVTTANNPRHAQTTTTTTRSTLPTSLSTITRRRMMTENDNNDNVSSSSSSNVSMLLETAPELREYFSKRQQQQQQQQQQQNQEEEQNSSMESLEDPLWEQVKRTAKEEVERNAEAGPQLYQGIISQPSLLESVVTVISLEIESELIPATQLKNLFLDMLTWEDDVSIHLDTMAACNRSPSIGSALNALLFHKGLHALVCYRVGHRLWQAGRTGLAYYMQSTVSQKYSADIHPACTMGSGVYLNCGGGVVIGETARVGNDVSILQGVTLGGTGKEAGDRHPKVGNGVILHDGATVLGNIQVGDGAIITAKSIVTKPVPPLARVSGIPAKIQNYRIMTKEALDEADMFERDLGYFYMKQWQNLAPHTKVVSPQKKV